MGVHLTADDFDGPRKEHLAGTPVTAASELENFQQSRMEIEMLVWNAVSMQINEIANA